LILINPKNAGGGAEDFPRLSAGTRQLADGRKPASVVHHLAENCETIIPDVERS
jgi:hypothetical protein